MEDFDGDIIPRCKTMIARKLRWQELTRILFSHRKHLYSDIQMSKMMSFE
jgi:hypothetical protein